MPVLSNYGIYASIGIKARYSVLADYGIDTDNDDNAIIQPLNITTYITSAGSGQEKVFSYPDEQIKTAFDGAKIKIGNVDGTPPYSYTTSDHNIAVVDATGIITLKDAKKFSITIRDSEGKVGIFSLSPSLYFFNDGLQQAWADANNSAISKNGRLPTARESSQDEVAFTRGIGSLTGEWGDFINNNSGWIFEGGIFWWTATSESTGTHEAISYSGEELTYSDSTIQNALVVVFDNGKPQATVQMVNNVMFVAVIKGNE